MTHGRALGDADYKDPKPFVSAEASVRRLDLLPEDKAVIIASDGLWDVIGDQDVVTMVDQLIQVCNLSGRQYACLLKTGPCICECPSLSNCHSCPPAFVKLAGRLISSYATAYIELQAKICLL